MLRSYCLMLKVNITPNNYFRTPRINLSTAIKYIKPQLLFMIPLSNFVLLRYPPNSFFKVVILLLEIKLGINITFSLLRSSMHFKLLHNFSKTPAYTVPYLCTSMFLYCTDVTWDYRSMVCVVGCMEGTMVQQWDSSFYRSSNSNLLCLHKKIWDTIITHLQHIT